MKNLLLIAIAILGFSAVSFGQVNEATASASGTIITPILITKTSDLKFGNMVLNGGGSVVMNPATTPSYTGVTVFSQPGTISPAKFDVNGSASFLYTVTLSATPATVKHTDGITLMPIVDWKCYINDLESTAGTLNASGYQEVKVGATLTVGAAQKAGVYSSATDFKVTVDYN